MSKPKIYAYCAAGCKWETIHKTDVPARYEYLTLSEYNKLTEYEDDVMYFVYDEGHVVDKAELAVKAVQTQVTNGAWNRALISSSDGVTSGIEKGKSYILEVLHESSGSNTFYSFGLVAIPTNTMISSSSDVVLHVNGVNHSLEIKFKSSSTKVTVKLKNSSDAYVTSGTYYLYYKEIQ